MGMTETAILKTAAHELTHFIQANSAQYEALKSFVVNKLTHEEGVSFEDLVADKQRREPGLEYDEAVDEVVADACEMMLGNSTVVEQLAKENRSLAEKIRDWLREWVENLKIALEGLQADRTESRAMMQYVRELQEIWDNALMDAARNNRGTMEKAAPAESRQQARVGTDEESGKPIYQANFPKGTPKAAKAQRILSLIQNVWSKKPISLVVQDADGSTRRIEAKFDPTFDEGENTRTDASKMMVGNRHGSASEQRVTLDLADDYYEIAAESTYNYSKSETGKSSATHEGVKQWHYFINDILFQEYGEKETTPYRVTINVKERSDGDYVYSFSAERQNERSSTRRTLHADVNQTAKDGEANAQPSIDSIRQSNDNSQEKSSDKVQSSMRDSAGRELTEAQQAYFKDSKVRDADGKLLVMYHQTDGTFTVFDTKHKGAGAGDDETPFGIFLKRTPRNIGVRGEKQMELYADIRNPLRVRDRTELVSKLRELSVDYAQLKDESAQIDKEYGAKFEEAKNAFKSFLIQWRKNNPDAPPRAAYDADGFDTAFNAEDNVVKEWTRAKDELALRAKTSITQALRDNGYDGVILENDKGSWGRSTDAYIALDANQVKNTTNKTPTADPDIRYQQRDNLKEEYHLTDDEESAIRGAAREAIPAESRRQAQAESGESIEPGEKPLKGKHDNDKMGAVKDSLKEDLKNGKARKEDRGAFLRRATGEGLRVFEGDSIAYGYRSVRRESARENARQVQKELTALGIDAEITDGYVHWNLDGISCKRAISQAVTIERRRILISNRVSLPSKNAAGHEAFHLWGGTQAREAYANEVVDNLNYSSREFVEYQAVIAEAYLGGEADLSDSTQLQKLREELFAYISGDIHEGVNDDLLRPMFHDYDAVKAAWVKLCKDNSDSEVRFSLRSVPPVKPQNGGWERGATFDEVKTEHPTLFALDADESSTRNPTQISGTVKSYRKIFDALKEEGFDGTILDASSGLGYGTRLGREEYGYRVDDIEPFPDAKYKPRYTDYSALDNTYDAIISNAVLNVIPQDLRDAMVVKIGEMLNPGGRAFINVRGTDVKNASSKVAINESGMEYFISNTGSYQKGFTTKELVSYLRDALGDGFTVRATNKFGAVSAIVTKNEERVQSQQRDPRLSDRDVLRMAADMAQRDRSQRWSVEDLNRFDLLQRKLLQLDEANAELEALKEERKVLLAGRKVKELTRDEQFELAQNRNRTETQKGKMFVNRI